MTAAKNKQPGPVGLFIMKKFTFAEADRILKGAEHLSKGKPDEFVYMVNVVLSHVKERNPKMERTVVSNDFEGYADFYSWFYSFMVSDRA